MAPEAKFLPNPLRAPFFVRPRQRWAALPSLPSPGQFLKARIIVDAIPNDVEAEISRGEPKLRALKGALDMGQSVIGVSKEGVAPSGVLLGIGKRPEVELILLQQSL